MKTFLHRAVSFILLLLLGIVCYAGFRFYSFVRTPASDTPREFVLSIAPGSGFDRVAYDLKKEGAVSDVDLFRILARLEGSLGRIQAGEYLISTGRTPEQILRQITGGKALLYRLSVREGLTWWETAATVEQQGFARFEDFRDVIRDPEFLRAHNIPFADAEGFLFPETYLLPKPRSPLDREQAEKIASLMVETFWKKTEELWRNEAFKKKGAPQGGGTAQPPPVPAPVPGSAPQGGDPTVKSPEANVANAARMPAASNDAGRPDRAAAPGPGGNGAASLPETPEDRSRTPAKTDEDAVDSAIRIPVTRIPAEVDPEAVGRLVILASLVEKETGLPDERGQVAGVFANRLRLGMLLQCDPTIIYGMGESFRGSIRRSHIDDDKNPYNTYRHIGLPPGPICSPGLEALKAAFAPTGHDFLYFVARGTGAGHNFSKTLDEHNRAVQLYRARPRGGNNP
ncbi:MAG: endolytic transglycosylase MltG [Desulfovibrio sp.]|jgi:cell division protein YceG involved in septum cleavage|nr:endolytic transglycosylase MltG [Desulfovibrio sp.]